MLEEANTRLRNKLEIDEWLARVMEEAEQEAAKEKECAEFLRSKGHFVLLESENAQLRYLLNALADKESNNNKNKLVRFIKHLMKNRHDQLK